MLSSLLVFLIIGLLPAFSQQSLFQEKEFITSNGQPLPYRILFPESMEPGESYPVVLFLHGAGERGNDNEKQLIHGSSLFLDAENREKYPAIVVFPQCPENEWWSPTEIVGMIRTADQQSIPNDYDASEAMQSVMELMAILRQDPVTDTTRMYVMGLSMGAFGIFDLLHRQPQWFAAAVPICGGGDQSKAAVYADDVPLWIFHGSEDSVVPVEASRAMKEAVEKAGGTVRYTEYEGVDHNSWDPAFAEPELLPWLFSHKRKTN
ncbi:MAG: alpha/beta hydrolase-fold protein [Bacteroidota bacterium]